MFKKYKNLRGGIHPLDHKEADVSVIRDIEINKGDEFFIPFIQHIGSPSVAAVHEGEEVIKGQLLAECGAGLGSRVHSSVTGIVKSVSTVPHYIFGNVPGCIIEVTETEGEYCRIKGGATLSETVKEAGIVGLGGAGFPTHIKLSPKNHIDTIIINGSECEPYLMCDHALMLNKPKNIIQGALLLKEYLKASACIIAVENNKKDCIIKLSELSSKYNGIDVVSLPVKYPQGSEKQLIYSILSKTVPSGGLPSDIGVVIQNVATVNAVYEAVNFSKPLYERVVTISGDTQNPSNYKIPNGMKVSDIFSRTSNPYNNGKVIFGGPMTGSSLSSLDIPVIKTTGGILQLNQKSREQIQPCIRCGKCSEVCVMGLVPRELEASFINNETEKNIKNGIMSCIECGCCSYICPSGRLLAETIKAGKKYAAKLIKEKK